MGGREMNQIAARRLSLSIASVCFGVLTALMLLCSVVYDGKPALASQSGDPSVVEYTAQTLSFPIPISCTTLVVEDLAAYDGAFFEDGTGREVFNVAALMLRNTSDQLVPYAHVVIHSTDCTYVFDGFMIPAGAAALIPEKNAQKLSSIAIEDCFGWSTVMEDSRQYAISVSESGMDKLSVTNLSDAPIQNLTLYHKTYLEEWGFYMGGRAAETTIERILPGQTVVVYPKQYAAGYSKVVYYE